MDIADFNEYLRGLPGKLSSAAPHIVAETAVEYYKDAFRKKAFGADIWTAGKPKRSGSLLVQSGALLNSIGASEVTERRVVVSAGNMHVPYAEVHNEGYEGVQWVKRRKGGGPFAREQRIPRRQYMGYNAELGGLIGRRLADYLEGIL